MKMKLHHLLVLFIVLFVAGSEAQTLFNLTVNATQFARYHLVGGNIQDVYDYQDLGKALSKIRGLNMISLSLAMAGINLWFLLLVF